MSAPVPQDGQGPHAGTDGATVTTTDTNAHLGERLQALLDRELPPGDEAAARAHLASCADCAGRHARLAGAMTAVAGLGRARAPMGFAARVLKRVRAQRRGHGLRASIDQKVHYEGGIIVLLAAAAAALILAYGVHAHGGLFAKAEAPAAVPATGHP
jgi:anti-sigma factor RsiW